MKKKSIISNFLIASTMVSGFCFEANAGAAVSRKVPVEPNDSSLLRAYEKEMEIYRAAPHIIKENRRHKRVDLLLDANCKARQRKSIQSNSEAITFNPNSQEEDYSNLENSSYGSEKSIIVNLPESNEEYDHEVKGALIKRMELTFGNTESKVQKSGSLPIVQEQTDEFSSESEIELERTNKVLYKRAEKRSKDTNAQKTRVKDALKSKLKFKSNSKAREHQRAQAYNDKFAPKIANIDSDTNLQERKSSSHNEQKEGNISQIENRVVETQTSPNIAQSTTPIANTEISAIGSNIPLQQSQNPKLPAATQDVGISGTGSNNQTINNQSQLRDNINYSLTPEHVRELSDPQNNSHIESQEQSDIQINANPDTGLLSSQVSQGQESGAQNRNDEQIQSERGRIILPVEEYIDENGRKGLIIGSNYQQENVLNHATNNNTLNSLNQDLNISAVSDDGSNINWNPIIEDPQAEEDSVLQQFEDARSHLSEENNIQNRSDEQIQNERVNRDIFQDQERIFIKKITEFLAPKISSSAEVLEPDNLEIRRACTNIQDNNARENVIGFMKNNPILSSYFENYFEMVSKKKDALNAEGRGINIDDVKNLWNDEEFNEVVLQQLKENERRVGSNTIGTGANGLNILNSVFIGSQNSSAQSNSINKSVQAAFVQSRKNDLETAKRLIDSLGLQAYESANIAAQAVSNRTNDLMFDMLQLHASNFGTENVLVASGEDSAKKAGFWIAGNIAKASKKDQYDASFKGASIGLDANVSDNSIIGFAYTFVNSSGKTKKAGSTDTIDQDSNYNIGSLYGALTSNNFVFSTSVSYGKGEIKHENTKDPIDVKVFGANLGVGYNIKFDKTILTPNVQFKHASFTFVGSNDKKLNFDASSVAIGARVSYLASSTQEVKLIHYVGANVEYGFANDKKLQELIDTKGKNLLGAQYSPTDNTLQLPVKGLGANIEAGLNIKSINSDVDFIAGYTLSLKRDYAAHQGSLKLRVGL